MLCVRCKHELPPRADRCLRCFALNPQNRAAATPAPAPKPASVRAAKLAPAAEARPAPLSLEPDALASSQGAGLSIESKPPPRRLPMRDLSIESDPPPFGNPLQLSIGSDPPPAAVGLDFSSDPAPPDPSGEPPLSVPPLGLPRRPASKRVAARGRDEAPAYRVAGDPPDRRAGFDEIPAEEIDELSIAREPSFYERPTEPPSAPPPADTLDEGAEVEHLRARLAEAASAHAWGQAGAPEDPLGPGSTTPFASPLPPLAPGRPTGPMGLPSETTPGWVAAQQTDRAFVRPERAAAPAAPRTPPPSIAKARAAAEAAARADAAEEITLREPSPPAPQAVTTPPAPERTAQALRALGPPLKDPALPDEAPPVHPARPAARALAPALSPPPPLPTPPPPGPPRAGARARLASWASWSGATSRTSSRPSSSCSRSGSGSISANGTCRRSAPTSRSAA